MFSRFFHNSLPNKFASCKENIIKFLIQKTFVFCTPTRNYRNIFWRKVFCKDFFYYFTSICRICTWFYNNSVTSRNCIYKWRKSQHKWIIPRTHNEHNTVRRRLTITSGSKLCKWSMDTLFFCIGMNMLQHIVNFT